MSPGSSVSWHGDHFIQEHSYNGFTDLWDKLYSETVGNSVAEVKASEHPQCGEVLEGTSQRQPSFKGHTYVNVILGDSWCHPVEDMLPHC